MALSIHRAALPLVLACLLAGAGRVVARGDGSGPAREAHQPGAVFNPAEEALLDELQQGAFRFFLEQADPRTGLVRDRARADGSASEGKASIAATGFALSAWAVATERGWTDRDFAVGRVRTMLRFLAHDAPRVHGFFYHFMEPDTGARAWKCELSTIDTGLFLAGAIVAREYFQDAEITALVNQLYREVDWGWFLNGGRTFAMGWHDEAGFSRFRWDKYSELMMLTLLGLGAPVHPIAPELWAAWSREPVGDYAGYHYIQGPPLFVHQFTQAYVDFRGLRDAFADYYRNSTLATLAQREFCLNMRSEFPTWNERLWGLTASDSATGYKAWGGPPRTLDYNALDGTVVPCAPAGSLPFAPRETMATLEHMRAAYGDRIWGRYGFVDAFNPETGWVNPDVIGIDLGITLLQAENARSGLVWSIFMQAPEVKQAMERAGFASQSRVLDRGRRDAMRQLAVAAWRSLQEAPVTAESAGLRISSLVAAQALGLVSGEEAATTAAAMLKGVAAPLDGPAVAEYAAGLVTLRQAIPRLGAEITQRLTAIDWAKVKVGDDRLGARDRLTVFFQVAAGVRTAAAWTALKRVPERVGPVYTLAPASVVDQLVPGLWLDERAIESGASAAQLAYACARKCAGFAGSTLCDLPTVALLIEHFPALVADRLVSQPPENAWWQEAAPAQRAALLVSVANLIAPEALRLWFQRDPLAAAGRKAIGEFAAEEFGRRTSVFWRHELAGPLQVPPERLAAAVPARLPRDKWKWVDVAGVEFRDSSADLRPGDPALNLRFAFTWDETALHFHADVTDGLPQVTKPSGRCGVELFLDARNEGFVWSPQGRGNLQYSYKAAGAVMEWMHKLPANGKVTPTATGYRVEAAIPWKDLGVKPQPGLELGVSPAVISEGTAEWEPSLKLNWRYYQRADERYGLGRLRLE